MLAFPVGDRIAPPVVARVRNDRRSPYRIRVTNVGWNEREDDVIIEVLAGRKRLARLPWRQGFPNVYAVRAARQWPSDDVLIAATCDGRLTQDTGIWRFSPHDGHLTSLAQAISNAVVADLARGRILERGVDRWTFDPPRGDSPDGWFHRSWRYDARTRRLTPGLWQRGIRVR